MKAMPRYRITPLPLDVVYQPACRPSLKVQAFVGYFTEAFARDPDIAAEPDAAQADAAGSAPLNPAAVSAA